MAGRQLGEREILSFLEAAREFLLADGKGPEAAPSAGKKSH